MTALNSADHPLVLIVEDDVALREVFREALESNGYSTCIASNGVEGLERFEERVPNLILLDLIMPRMDGWEALERLRRVSDCPVIIVTAKGTAEDIIRGLLESGADDYLVKPFGIDELCARVKAVLRRSVPTRQAS